MGFAVDQLIVAPIARLPMQELGEGHPRDRITMALMGATYHATPVGARDDRLILARR